MVDLGAAPGGWSQVAAKRVGAAEGKGRVVAIDHPRHGADPGRRIRCSSIFSTRTRRTRLKALLGGPADVVLSDMAANATGHRKTDHLKIMALVEAAAEFAREVLAPGGAFLAKVLQGGTEATLLAELKRDFASVKHVKPAASRAGFGRALPAGDRLSRRRNVSLPSWSASRRLPARPAFCRRLRPASSAPASGGSRTKTKTAQAEIERRPR